MDNNYIYVSKIYEYMFKNHLTQKEFAKKSGLTEYRLRMVLKGDIKSIVYSIDKIAIGMGVDRADLVKLD